MLQRPGDGRHDAADDRGDRLGEARKARRRVIGHLFQRARVVTGILAKLQRDGARGTGEPRSIGGILPVSGDGAERGRRQQDRTLRARARLDAPPKLCRRAGDNAREIRLPAAHLGLQAVAHHAQRDALRDGERAQIRVIAVRAARVVLRLAARPVAMRGENLLALRGVLDDQHALGAPIARAQRFAQLRRRYVDLREHHLLRALHRRRTGLLGLRAPRVDVGERLFDIGLQRARARRRGVARLVRAGRGERLPGIARQRSEARGHRAGLLARFDLECLRAMLRARRRPRKNGLLHGISAQFDVVSRGFRFRRKVFLRLVAQCVQRLDRRRACRFDVLRVLAREAEEVFRLSLGFLACLLDGGAQRLKRGPRFRRRIADAQPRRIGALVNGAQGRGGMRRQRRARVGEAAVDVAQAVVERALAGRRVRRSGTLRLARPPRGIAR
ncbi:hypothetical protein AWB81_08097 [Caballeronia arationis]|nr:hypothetical protein AWB81_08097 [Caballeronia arationis]